MKTKEKRLKAIYKALELLMVAQLNIRECKELLNSKGNIFDIADDSVANIAFRLLKESEKLIKEMDR